MIEKHSCIGILYFYFIIETVNIHFQRLVNVTHLIGFKFLLGNYGISSSYNHIDIINKNNI